MDGFICQEADDLCRAFGARPFHALFQCREQPTSGCVVSLPYLAIISALRMGVSLFLAPTHPLRTYIYIYHVYCLSRGTHS